MLNLFTTVHAAQTISGVQRLEEGIADYEHGEYDNAVFKLEMAVYQIPEEEKVKLWDAHLYLGLSYLLVGNVDESTKKFSKAQVIIKNKLPGANIHSPKIIRLFRETQLSQEGNAWKDSVADIEFVFVKGGCFDMGDTFDDGYDNEKPVHEVCVDDFYISKCEVTQGQWENVMGTNPSDFKNGNNYPVENVSWNDVQDFIRALKKKTGENYRLPREAEWEYAARIGGKRVRFGTGNNTLESGEANFDASEKYKKNYSYVGEYRKQTTLVKTFAPNALGLYDMTGNVWEWCQDVFSSEAYSKHWRNNPIHTESGYSRVFRGGSWDDVPRDLRASYRSGSTPVLRCRYLGFRLVRTVD